MRHETKPSTSPPPWYASLAVGIQRSSFYGPHVATQAVLFYRASSCTQSQGFYKPNWEAEMGHRCSRVVGETANRLIEQTPEQKEKDS